VHPVAIMNLVGDSIHNLIDGIIIGASYLVNVQTGVATTLAVIFHEIPQEMGDFGILLHGNFTKKKALVANFLTSLTAICGAVIALAISYFTESIIIFLVPFAAGTFVYIAAADLIPEMHKGQFDLKNAVMQLFFFALGIIVMIMLL
jgi:zinc and cadmium transporter